MLNVKRSTVGALSTVALVLCLTLGLAACAPQTSEPGADADGSSAKTTQTAAGDGTGAYVSDEQCLSCHGGSYEALAETTSSYEQSNPHDSLLRELPCARQGDHRQPVHALPRLAA